MVIGVVGVFGFFVVEFVGLVFVLEGGCVMIYVWGMVGKDVMEVVFKLNDVWDVNVDGIFRKYWKKVMRLLIKSYL